MNQNKIVIRYADGHLMKGITNNFSADRETFHFIPVGASADSKPLEVHLANLKAVFFVKEFDSKPKSRNQQNAKAENNSFGRQIKVVFNDGEVLTGTTTSYNINRPGFFMIPTDPTSNNERCFVVRKAAKSITAS